MFRKNFGMNSHYLIEARLKTPGSKVDTAGSNGIIGLGGGYEEVKEDCFWFSVGLCTLLYSYWDGPAAAQRFQDI